MPGSVHAELDPRDWRLARPGPALDWALAALDDAAAGQEIGKARWQHQGPRPHPLRRRAGIVRSALVAIGDALLVAGEGLADGLDPGQPLHLRHAVPAG